jgi:adenylate cyclase
VSLRVLLSRRAISVIGPIAIGLLMTLFTLLVLQSQPAFQRAELATYDEQFLQRGYIGTPDNIVVVEVNAGAVAWFGGNVPVQRRHIADAINHLKKAGAKVIGIDFEYEAPSDSKDDKALASAIKNAGNVVLTQKYESDAATQYVQQSFQLVPPIDMFARHAAALGLANYPEDTDSNVRRALPMQSVQLDAGRNSGTYPLLPVSMASVYLHEPVSAVVRNLPKTLYINYIGPSSVAVNATQVWPRYGLDTIAEGFFPKSAVRNKIVLIIPADLDFKDELNTPFGGMWGGYVQANTLATILRDDTYTPAGTVANDLILIILGVLTTLAASRFGIWRSTLVTVVLAGAFVGVDIELFRQFRIWADLVTPEAGLVLGYAAIMGFRFATEERLKRKTNRAFGLYLRPEVVDLLVESEDPTKALQPARRDISVLFVDVRGFTSMSEHMQPEEVVDTLDVYLEELTAAVQDSGGTLNKYVGDEIMAMWNTPLNQPDHAMRAVRCALDMVVRGERINEQLSAKGRPTVRYGIGVNSGTAVVGQMGSTFRKQFDVIGDTVNTGARLCSAAAGMETIIGQGTWEVIGDQLVVEETEPLTLKGKSDTIRTFKVLEIVEAQQPAASLAAQPAAV